MKRTDKFKAGLQVRKIAFLVLGVLWFAILIGVAVPAWRHAAQRHQEVQALEEQLAELDNWAVAGMWLERSLKEKAPEVNQVWSTMFPEQRNRETLFLDLAGIADRSGVSDFDLAELREPRMEKDNQWLTHNPLSSGGADQNEVQLSFYRVRANFLGDFEQVARFLGGLKQIERAMSVHSMEIEADRQWVRVDLKLDVYVKQSS